MTKKACFRVILISPAMDSNRIKGYSLNQLLNTINHSLKLQLPIAKTST